jgi:ketosteroid isomerase-like protein
MAATSSEPVAVVKQVFAEFNKGDMKAVEAAFANDSMITDDFAPYLWRGPSAMQNWLDGLDASIKSGGLRDLKVTVSSISNSGIDGDAAYVVARLVLTYKQHGHRMSASGANVLTLQRGPEGWKVTSSALGWSNPQAVAPRPKLSAAAPPTAPAPATAPAKKQ